MTLPKYLLSAGFLLVLGLGTAAMATGYRLGTLQNMGPGMFPLALGLGIAALAIVYLIAAHRSPEERQDAARFSDGRPLVLILASVVAFGVLLGPAGLIIALSVLITGCWFANPDRKWKELPIMLMLYNGMAIVIFVYLLNIPIRLGPL